MNLTILVPCYNEQYCISNTIENIIKEIKNKNFSYEILCVNNTSTDSTENILQCFANKYEQVIYVNTINIKKDMGSLLLTGIKILYWKRL